MAKTKLKNIVCYRLLVYVPSLHIDPLLLYLAGYDRLNDPNPEKNELLGK